MEMLLTFFIWVIIIFVMVPTFLFQIMKSKDLEIIHAAESFLSNQVIQFIVNQNFDINHSIYRNEGEEFLLHIEERDDTIQICVQFMLSNQTEKKICRVIQNI